MFAAFGPLSNGLGKRTGHYPIANSVDIAKHGGDAASNPAGALSFDIGKGYRFIISVHEARLINKFRGYFWEKGI
jgi:hypothetical protein